MKTHDGHLPYMLEDGKKVENSVDPRQPGSSTRVYHFPLYELNEVKVNLKVALKISNQKG